MNQLSDLLTGAGWLCWPRAAGSTKLPNDSTLQVVGVMLGLRQLVAGEEQVLGLQRFQTMVCKNASWPMHINKNLFEWELEDRINGQMDSWTKPLQDFHKI